ncbi:hypothetical protein HWV62_5656 [Athelia sp. TMB]|nr:hypothetical protein HWV62_5656 [Athelia sp. TMB]
MRDYKPCFIEVLPEELLKDIFICRASNDYGATITSRGEIVLSHVCHYWREVSISTPQLWTRVHRRVRQRHLSPISTYLARSKQMPLDLIVHAAYQPSSPWADQEFIAESLVGVCELLEPHISRCRKIEFYGENSANEDPFLQMLASISMPILQSLHLSPRVEGGSFEAEQAVLFNDDAPMLRRVSLRFSQALRVLTVPLPHVTHLRFDISDRITQESAYGPPWITEQLARCPLLVHLDLGIIAISPSWNGIHLNLPLLLTMSFVATNWDTTSAVLGAFECVSLEHLNIAVQYTEWVPTARGPLKFPLLRKLSLSQLISPAPPFPHMSILFPLISELSFNHSLDVPGLIDRFDSISRDSASAASTSIILPHLKTIGINAEPPVDELRSLLTGRAEHGGPIEQLLVPREHIAKGREIASAMEPPVAVGEFVEFCPFQL